LTSLFDNIAKRRLSAVTRDEPIDWNFTLKSGWIPGITLAYILLDTLAYILLDILYTLALKYIREILRLS
jgi:hypothetical protein